MKTKDQLEDIWREQKTIKGHTIEKKKMNFRNEKYKN